MAEAHAVSPAYPYGNQAAGGSGCLYTASRKRRFFVIPEGAIRREIGVCGCHGPPGVGALVELPHYRKHLARARCSESVKILLKKM